MSQFMATRVQTTQITINEERMGVLVNIIILIDGGCVWIIHFTLKLEF